MGRFYVGQRVRIVDCNFRPDLVGKETIITSSLIRSWHSTKNKFYDCYRVSIDPIFGARPDQLEPITDSYDIVAWEECLWQPSPETV